MKPLQLLALSIIPLGIIIAAVPPDRVQHFRLTADELLQEAGAGVKYVSPDVVADMLVQKDPSLRLIDVRTPEEYEGYSMPGAINVPLSNLLADEYTDILNQEAYMNVFYSNGSVYANQAWMITRQLGYANNYVLTGGLNYWTETVMNPEAPGNASPNEEILKYNLRKGAGMALGGDAAETAPQMTTPGTKPPVQKRETKKRVQGGC